MLCAVTNCDGNAVAPRGAFCAAHEGQTIDPTVHALALIGARVLTDVVRGGIPPQSCSGDALDGLIVSWQDDMYGEWNSCYATTQIAATVAALTQTGGSDA